MPSSKQTTASNTSTSKRTTPHSIPSSRLTTPHNMPSSRRTNPHNASSSGQTNPHNALRSRQISSSNASSSRQVTSSNTSNSRQATPSNSSPCRQVTSSIKSKSKQATPFNPSPSRQVTSSNMSNSRQATPSNPLPSRQVTSSNTSNSRQATPSNPLPSRQVTPSIMSKSRQATPSKPTHSRQANTLYPSTTRQRSLFTPPIFGHDSPFKKRRDVRCRGKREPPTTSQYGKSRKRERMLTSFEKDLLKEGLYVPGCKEASAPVLKICYEMEDFELVTRKSVFASYFKDVPRPHEFNWEASLLEPHVIKIVSALYEGEPVLDGLPASMWLSCMEPALPMLVTLNTMKHRRTNLALCERGLQVVDVAGDLHGDMNIPVGPDLRPARQPEEDYSMGEADVPIIETIKYHRQHPNRPRNERHYFRPHQCALVDW